MINEIIEKLKEREIKDLPASQKPQNLNFLADILRKEIFNGNQEHDILSMIAFYSYVYENYDKFYSEQYRKPFSITIGNYYTMDRIKNDFDKFVEDRILLDAIMNLNNKTLINDLIDISYEKAKENEKYKLTYDFIKEKAISLGFDVTKYVEVTEKVDLDKQLEADVKKEVESDSAKSFMDVINGQSEIEATSQEFIKEIDKVKETFNEKVKESSFNSNEQKTAKQFDFIDNFSSTQKISEEERKTRYKEFEQNRRVAKENSDKVIGNIASDLNVDRKDIYKAVEKTGINPLNLKEGDIIITPDMVKKIAANEMVNSLPQTRYVKFINNLFSKLSFKNSEINVEVSDIDKSKKIIIAPGKQEQKIAKAEKKLLEVQRISQNIKKCFVDTKNNAKEAIKNVVTELKEKSKARNDKIRTNISNSLYNLADKLAPRSELENMQESNVIANSGEFVASVPSQLLLEEDNRKTM